VSARNRRAAGVGPGWARALVGAACLTLLVVACRTKRPGKIYRLDSETRGWVVIVFNRPEAPPLPMLDGRLLIDVPKSGVAVTSTKSPVGYGQDVFRIRYPDGRESLLDYDSIRAHTVGTSQRGDAKRIEIEVFFVGTRAELASAEKKDDVVSRVHTMLP
jgi:hypothetical protein